MKRGESETAEEFSARVQSSTAAALSVETSNHTVADKVDQTLFYAWVCDNLGICQVTCV